MNQPSVPSPFASGRGVFGIWLVVTIGVVTVYSLLAKFFFGHSPMWVVSFPMFAAGLSLGTGFGKHLVVDRRAVLYFVGAQGSMATLGLALAGVVKATSGF